MQTKNNHKQAIIIGIISFIIVGGLFIVFTSNKAKNAASVEGKTTTYTDPTSGQKIVTQDGKVREGDTNGATEPQFAGFDILLDRGMTLQQVQTTYKNLSAYKPFAKSTTQISLSVNDVQSIDPEDSDPEYRWSIQSKIVVNKTDTYQIRIYYSGVAAVQVLLHSADGSQLLYDSSETGE